MKTKISIAGIICLIFLSAAVKVFAGGGPVEFTVEPNTSLNPGEQYVVHARVYADGPSYPAYCKGCTINLAFENPQGSDYISQSSDKTDEDGRIYAKVISKIAGKRTLILKDRIITDANGKVVTANSYVTLNYNGDTSAPAPTPIYSYEAPVMVYPQNGEVIDLEGSYNFKVNLVPGATGYLFGFFRDGKAFFENYANLRTLSTNGEFNITEDMPGHAKFQAGNVDVWVRALINNKWTDARIITITLKPRSVANIPQVPISTPFPVPAGEISVFILNQQFIAPFYRGVTIKWSALAGNIFYRVYSRQASGKESGWKAESKEAYGPSYDLKMRADEDYYVKVQGCLKKIGTCVDSNELFIPKLKKQAAETAIPSPSIIPGASIAPVSADTVELEQKVDSLQKQLEQSQKKQAVLEQTVNNLVKWIKSFFPFFK